MKQHPSYGPDPNAVYPNEAVKQVCFLKNVITRPNIQVGEYTYYDDIDGPEQFQDHVTHHYPFLGDKLIIGKFCAIARGIEFVMNGANHRMNSVTTYPFNLMGHGWEKVTPTLEQLPFKGDTVVGNDVWIGQNVTVLPGVHIGDGAIVAANGPYYQDSGGAQQAGQASGIQATGVRIEATDPTLPYPVFLRAEGNSLGWMKKEALQVVSKQ